MIFFSRVYHHLIESIAKPAPTRLPQMGLENFLYQPDVTCPIGGRCSAKRAEGALSRHSCRELISRHCFHMWIIENSFVRGEKFAFHNSGGSDNDLIGRVTVKFP